MPLIQGHKIVLYRKPSKSPITMKTALIFTLGITLTTAFVTAHAQTYQWKDSSGRTVISDTPPPGVAAKEARAIGGRQPAFAKEEKQVEKAAEAPKSTAEKDLDFKKRQQEAREKTEKDAKEQKAAADKRDNCERARRNLAALEADQPMATLDEKGEAQRMDSNQRNQEMERARQFITESCK
ncbi:DUF4124 domain-containing protein [Dechloromonas denitrificans]|uniref:DUF4124 domain-containing protein n=1 Tax=Dechloromonas denitrificans TaxID=281362 RepID=UPI001CF8B05D|nr:DUF4124 domain-containing protein [Dechloromonas denitrificans]UCV01847.1 DUF4124 domain-containing protein [Dechloromonas denitrificans]UCV06198.1 DUF4124 domain-containing protein [Dechloromonas denitrificans]